MKILEKEIKQWENETEKMKLNRQGILQTMSF